MFLLFDIGNSAVKWAFSVSGRLQTSGSFYYALENLKSELMSNVQHAKYGKPDAVLISNVAGDAVTQALIQWCKSCYQLTPLFPCSTARACGLENTYSPPTQLGVDRWLALIAANHLFSGAICVVDCGTAATVDVIDDDGRFIGGVILPGLHVMRQSLQRNADAIEWVSSHEIKSMFALSTEQCVLAGTTLAITASIEEMTRKLQSLTGQESTCVLTGGDAEKVIPYLSIPVEHVTDLVMQGLYLWGRENGLGV